MERFLLHDKVLGGNIDEIVATIKQCKDIDELDDFGCSALHWAVINMQEEVVSLLLMYHANSTITSGQGFTPENYAKKFGYYHIGLMLSA